MVRVEEFDREERNARLNAESGGAANPALGAMKSIVGKLQEACSSLESCELSTDMLESSISGLQACQLIEEPENGVVGVVNDLANRLEKLDRRLKILNSTVRHEDE